MGDRPRPRRADQFILLSAALLLGGIAASCWGAVAWRSYVESNSVRAFTATANAARAALGVELQRDSDLTNTARTLVEMSPGLTNLQLDQWFGHLRSGERSTGVFGMVYVEKVRRGQLATFSSAVAVDPPFGIPSGSGFSLHPDSKAASFCFTRYGVADLPPGVSALLAILHALVASTASDLDFCALPIGRLLAESAASGSPVATGVSSLLSDAVGVGRQRAPVRARLLDGSGLLAVIAPAYSTPTTPGSPGARLDAVTGWSISLYQAEQLVDPIIAAEGDSSIVLGFRNPAGNDVLLAEAGRLGAHDLTLTFRLGSSGSWFATYSAPGVTSHTSATLQWLAILLLGLVVTVLLAALVRTLARGRKRALELADARSSELRHQALHDSLTSLPNRALIFDRTVELLAEARRNHRPVTVLFVDLDGFKDVNDTFGHLVGDELLRKVAQRFRSVLPGVDTVGRLGGDEFVVLMPGAGRLGECLADRLLEVLREPFDLGGSRALEVRISASIGIASGSLLSAEELLREADIALYEAKSLGKGRYAVYESAMHDALQQRLGLEFDLRSAMAEGQLYVEYQPLVELRTLEVRGAEALLRWQHPSRGLIPPDDFVPLLESSGAIVEVGRFVLAEACVQAALWRSAGRPLEVSVNVSARQLDGNELVDAVRTALATSGLDPRLLVLEITETAMMRDVDRSLRVLASLKSLGVQLAIDDFGTGYSSLSYLQRFAADSIKIDRSFIAAMSGSGEGAMLVHTLVQLGKALGLRTIAEGVEDGEQLLRLQAEGCNLAQGFLLHRPLGPEELLGLLEERAMRAPIAR